MDQFTNILIAFGCFQAFFLAIFLLAGAKRSLRKLLFAILLITEGITLLENVLLSSGLMETVPHLYGISYFLGFTRGPLLFLFALSLINPQFKLQPRHALHFIPFLILLGMGFQHFLLSAAEKRALFQDYGNGSMNSQSTTSMIIGILWYVHVAVYSWFSIKELIVYRRTFKKDVLAKWYLKIIIIFNVFLMIGFVYITLSRMGVITIANFGTMNMIIMTLLLQSLAYSFFRQQNFIDSGPKPIKGINVDELIGQLDVLLKQKKIFLDDALTINDVATQLSTTAKNLSLVINQRFGKTFKDLINGYRVDEAKALMATENGQNLQMLDVGLESGFNNKVSFYRVFKKSTGLSPSEYYEQIKAHATST